MNGAQRADSETEPRFATWGLISPNRYCPGHQDRVSGEDSACSDAVSSKLEQHPACLTQHTKRLNLLHTDTVICRTGPIQTEPIRGCHAAHLATALSHTHTAASCIPTTPQCYRFRGTRYALGSGSIQVHLLSNCPQQLSCYLQG